MSLADIPFDEALDVISIVYRLSPLDVGYDLRSENCLVDLGDEPTLRVSYPDEDGDRRVMTGPRAEVIARLESLGFQIAKEGPAAPEGAAGSAVLSGRPGRISQLASMGPADEAAGKGHGDGQE